jgi:paired amphipathic helix protein Sin3a
LEILQTYQKEQKQIKEVYSHVKLLFNGGAEDLLEEFKQFLPTIQNSQEEVPSSPQAYGGGLKRLTMSSLQQPPGVAQKKKKTYRKRSMLQQQQEDLHHHQEDHTISSSFTAFDPSKPSVSLEETDLFDRIKAHIGTKPSWEEFLKTLNLYTQQIVDMGLLIVQVKDFFQGDKELFDTFKKAIGYDPKEHPIERPSHSAEKPDLATCDAVIYSPSYRIVPKDWQNQPCSGRDQLCWEVLNDQFVSHPIWASEDSGFVASKKNSCEEALHRCEEERYEYDLNIEANLNTIALLEPIALRIQTMTPEEQNNMRLEPGLGGPTVSIYERIIKKVYDNDRGSEIIDMLYKRPATVIPVLLNRLKMKDKEWKKAQREWNKIWRDTDDKNFYRSLDYQGTTFKANDKKALIARALITEMDAKKKDTFVFEDKEVFKDVYHLIFDYMDNQSSGGFAKGDKQKIREFLRTFIPTFFQVKEERDDAQAGDDTAEYSSEDISAGGDSASPVINKEKNANGKLLKDVSVRNSPAVKVEEADEDIELTDAIVVPQTKANRSGLAEELNLFAPTTKRSVYTFYFHSPYFCLFRLYQILYERLLKMKSLDDQIKSNPALGKKFNQTALELDLYTNRFEGRTLEE